MSKNNPENRGQVTELRTYGGKKVKPVEYINIELGKRFIAAAYEDGNVVVDPNTKLPIPYASI